MIHSASLPRHPNGRGVRRTSALAIAAIVLGLVMAAVGLHGHAIGLVLFGLGTGVAAFAFARGILPRAASRLWDAVRVGAADLPVVLAMATVVASFSASLAFAHFRQRHIEDELAEILHDQGPGLERLAAVRTELGEIGRHLEAYVEGGAAERGAARADLRSARARREAEMGWYRALPTFPGEDELMAAIERRLALVDEATAATLERADDADRELARAERRRTFEPRLEEAYAAVEHLTSLDAGHVRARAESVLHARREGILIERVLGAVSVLSAVVATLLVVRAIRSRARLADAHARLVADRATELEAFAGRVAHDLKNPLGAVVLRTSLAKREPMTPAVAEHLASVDPELRRMSATIDRLLDLALAASRAKPAEIPDAAARSPGNS